MRGSDEPMEYRITTTYTRAISVLGAARFWRRFIARETVVGGLVAAAVIVATALGYDVPVLFLVLGAIGGLLAGLGTTIYFVVRGRSLDLFERMGSPTVEWTFTDDGIALKSELGQVVTKWKAVRKVWLFDDLWLVFFSKLSYSTLPIDDVPADARRFVIERLREAGAEIRPDPMVTKLIDF